MEPIRQLHDNFQPQSKLIIFCDGKILYDHDKKTYCFEPKDLNTLDSYSPFLSIAKDTLLDEYYYSIEIAPNTDILGIFMDPAKIEFTDFRTTLSFIDPSDFKLISRASILINWKAANQFCSTCGNKTLFNSKEGAPDCECLAPPRYPIISPCIITLIHDKDRILLGRSKFFPPNMFSTLAGFIEAGENAEEALVREVMEEVNVKVSDFLQKNRLYEILGLFILFIVGIMLISEGAHKAHLKLFGNEVMPMTKTTFYFVIAILVIIDIVQGKYQKKLMAKKQ